MEDLRFLRKTKTPLLLDEDDTPLLRLLRDLFIEHDAPYCVKALAAELGVSVFSVYKMFAADRPLRAETLLAIVRYINRKNPSDTRLLDLVCEGTGFAPMPKVNSAVREIIMLAHDLTKKEE